jgi:hypothetical protein
MFLQGKIDDHCSGGDLKTFLTDMINDALTNPHQVSLKSAKAHQFGNYTATYDMRVLNWKGDTDPASLPLGPWYEAIFKTTFPHQVLWWSGALFCINDALILNRNSEFYQKLLGEVSTQNAEAGHYLERVWLYVFLPDING